MFTVGLTGGVAAGKSTATNFFIDKGITVVDADLISRNYKYKAKRDTSKLSKNSPMTSWTPTARLIEKKFVK